jgi:hypothetical protein
MHSTKAGVRDPPQLRSAMLRWILLKFDAQAESSYACDALYLIRYALKSHVANDSGVMFDGRSGSPYSSSACMIAVLL